MGGSSRQQQTTDNSADGMVVPQSSSSVYTQYPQSIPSYQGNAQSFQQPQVSDTIPGQMQAIESQLARAYNLTPSSNTQSQTQQSAASNNAASTAATAASGNNAANSGTALNNGLTNSTVRNLDNGFVQVGANGQIPRMNSWTRGQTPSLLSDPGGASTDDMQAVVSILSDLYQGGR